LYQCNPIKVFNLLKTKLINNYIKGRKDRKNK